MGLDHLRAVALIRLPGRLKPDLVDFGGDEVFDRTGKRYDAGVGIPTTAANYMCEGQLFQAPNGTSFSAPAVAHAAARLFGRFPGASSNLVRTLLADSARLPAERPDSLPVDCCDEEILHGVPPVQEHRPPGDGDIVPRLEAGPGR